MNRKSDDLPKCYASMNDPLEDNKNACPKNKVCNPKPWESLKF